MKRSKIPYRTLIELLGLLVLTVGAWHERSLIVSAWQTIQNSNATLVLACFAIAWLNFLWSGIGYKLLVPKIRLLHICLANLAASGPGRVIPGGAGYLSFGVLFLRKQAIKTQKAVALATANNLMGFLVNISVLSVLFVLSPTLLGALNITLARAITVIAIVLFALLVIFLLGLNKRTKKSTRQTRLELRIVAERVVKDPRLFAALSVTMLATIGTNGTILYLAGHAVNLPIALDQAILAMSIGVGAGSLLPTPGGVGGVEAGLVAALILLGFDSGAAGGAVLIYRGATYIQPFIPGCISYVYLRHKDLL